MPKRNKNFNILPWRTQSNALWRHLSDSSVFQKTEIKMVFAKTSSLPSVIQLLPYLNNPMNMNPKERWLLSSKILKNEAIINFYHFAKFLKKDIRIFSILSVF